MAHRQLTLDERYQIVALRKQECGVCEIARRLGRTASTISRELRRNQTVREYEGKRVVSYDSHMAQAAAIRRRRHAGVARRKIQGELREVVEQRLLDGWSPEHICGRLRLENGSNSATRPSISMSYGMPSRREVSSGTRSASAATSIFAFVEVVTRSERSAGSTISPTGPPPRTSAPSAATGSATASSASVKTTPRC